ADAFLGAWLEPIEQRRVRFAVFLRSLQKLRQPFRHSCSLRVAKNIARNAALLLANAVLRNGVRCSRRSRRLSLQSTVKLNQLNQVHSTNLVFQRVFSVLVLTSLKSPCYYSKRR